MKTGDTVRDGRGRGYQVGPLIGRGTWGKTYTVRPEGGGPDLAMKVPLGADELRGDGARLAQQCREVAGEVGRLLEQGTPGLAGIETRFTTPEGVPVLLLPQAATTLERRIAEEAPIAELLTTVLKASERLQELRQHQPLHGNLRPGNLLIDDKGEVRLADPCTPTLRAILPQLAGTAGAAWIAPELRDQPGPAMDPSTDTYALAMMILAGVVGPDRHPLPTQGLDKHALVVFKDRVLDRLKREHSNPRFHSRLADQLSALLHRALSRETSPSPPFRFPKLDEWVQRLRDARALVMPTVEHVGKVILDRPPGGDSFTTDEEVGFSTSIGATAGVDNHEEIVCGIAVFDSPRDERLRDVACGYTVTRHPSGRFRFAFRIGGLKPGLYRVRVAFAIRDSGEQPTTAEGAFSMVAAPGYVPPREAPAPRPLSIDRNEVEAPTNAGAASSPSPIPPAAASGPTGSGVLTRPDALGAPALASAAPMGVVVSLPTPIAPAAAELPLAPSVQTPAPAAAGGPASSQAPGSPARGPVVGPTPRAALPLRPAATTPAVDDEPEYRGAGRWTDLPLPDEPEADLEDDLGPPSVSDEGTVPRAPGPVAQTLSRLGSVARGDSYLVFLALAALLIVGLLLALLAIG